jgi:hypothetical protein
MSLATHDLEASYPKLPFWDAVSFAYYTYVTNLKGVLRATWLWLIVTAALTATAARWQSSWMTTVMQKGVPPRPPPPTELIVLTELNNAVMIFAGVSIAVAWHRFMLLGERPAFCGSNVVSRNLWAYVLLGFLLCVVLFAPMAITLLSFRYFLPEFANPHMNIRLGGSSLALFLGPFVLYAVSTAIVLRLCPLLPARAVGATELTLRQTWKRTRGNTWRLFWGIALTTFLPLLAAQFVVLVWVSSHHWPIGSDEPLIRILVATPIIAAYGLLILPIGIGFVSLAYSHFFVRPLELPE